MMWFLKEIDEGMREEDFMFIIIIIILSLSLHLHHSTHIKISSHGSEWQLVAPAAPVSEKAPYPRKKNENLVFGGIYSKAENYRFGIYIYFRITRKENYHIWVFLLLGIASNPFYVSQFPPVCLLLHTFSLNPSSHAPPALLSSTLIRYRLTLPSLPFPVS